MGVTIPSMKTTEAVSRQPAIVYEALPCRIYSGEWLVEGIDHDADGSVRMARFSGPEAESRARNYAEWMNSSTRLTQGSEHEDRRTDGA